jgi:hypothetical protein
MGAGLTDGREMVLGGLGSGLTYEIFNPATGTWTSGALPEMGNHDMAMLLYNGKVLYLATTQPYLYDPRNPGWNPSGASVQWGNVACATLLKDGNVLLMYDCQHCKLYDYVGDTAATTGAAAVERIRAAEVMLPNGRVLIVGAQAANPAFGLKTCEIYDPGTGLWTGTGPMNVGRHSHVAVLLRPPWSRVLVAGFRTEKCELYDTVSGAWSYTGDMNVSGRKVEAMALLPSGEALIAGGEDWPGCLNSCEVYDPDAEIWSPTSSMTDPVNGGRCHFALSVLPTGKVLASGGGITSFTQTCEIYDPSDGEWAVRPVLKTGRAFHTVTPLPIVPTTNCSTNVLIAGGETSGGAEASCELYNYSLEHVSTTGPFNEARSHHTTVLLHSGQVLAAGGKDGSALSSSELFDVGNEAWTYTPGVMAGARYNHTATLLKNGNVLVTGGESTPGSNLSSCEVYSGGNWTPAGDMSTARTHHSAVILLNGDVLVIGGKTATGATGECEIWDGTGWSGATSLGTGRYWHTAVLLQSGKVLVIGGTADGSTPMTSCEIYSPGTDIWSSETSLHEARYAHNSTLLYSGLILTAGGSDGSAYLSSCEVYDPATHTWKNDLTGTLGTPRAYHSSVLIPDTMPFVLAIGGTDGSYLNSIEEYDVGLRYRSIWQSTITNYSSVTHVSDSMHIDGTLFREFSEADGGNHCHVVSNDHPIISLLRVGGGNWQGNGGGAILHMPLSSSWDETHTDVHPKVADFEGYYRLWSIVNGIPCKWYKECPTGVEEESNEQRAMGNGQLSVYPNPATTRSGVSFELSAPVSRFSSLEIYDLSGRTVRSSQITKSPNQQMVEIKVTGLAPGVYFYKIDCPPPLGGAHTITGKFTIVE